MCLEIQTIFVWLLFKNLFLWSNYTPLHQLSSLSSSFYRFVFSLFAFYS